MTLQYIHDDLFNAPQGFYLAHCISGDYTLGAGLAAKINEVYDMRFKLHRLFPINDYSEIVGSTILIDNVFNLIDKETYKDKATIVNLEKALLDMKQFCIELDIKKIAIPRIGCGKDKLHWDEVNDLIESIFDDTDVEIRVYIND